MAQPVTARLPPDEVLLATVPLASCGDWDRIFQSYDDLGMGEEITAALNFVATRSDPTRLGSDPGLRCAAAAAVVRAVSTTEQDSERLKDVRGIGDALRQGAPDAAETIFVINYLRYILFLDKDGGLAMGRGNREVGVALVDGLRALAAKHPTFVGPGRFDAARARDIAAQVAALLARTAAPVRKAAPLPVAPTPTGAPAEVTPSAAPGPPDALPAGSDEDEGDR